MLRQLGGIVAVQRGLFQQAEMDGNYQGGQKKRESHAEEGIQTLHREQ